MTRDAAPRSRAQLTWTDSAGSHALELTATRTAGSATSCELVVADKAVSRIHFELDPRPDGLWLTDLGSRNGTFVNGIMVVIARVPTGGTIRIGTTDMTVVYGPTENVETPNTVTSFGSLESRSPRMREVFTTLTAAAKTESSILLEGETGSGKRALARAIHDASMKADGPFVVVECAALARGDDASVALAEALASADGGTIVLDDPAELSLATQQKLVERLAGKRVIAMTQIDLRRLVNQDAFREDLYFQLAGVHVRVPPLRDRVADVVPLLERFLGEKASLVTPEIRADIERQPWLGNVHELRNHAERMREGDRIPEDASRQLRPADGELTTLDVPTIQTILGNVESAAADIGRMLPIALEPWFLIGFKEFRERWIELGEREYLRRLMLRTNRSSSTASREAGLERTYLYRLVKKHGI